MIIHVWMVIEPGAPYLAQHAALMQGLKTEKALVRDTWGVKPAPGLEPRAGDLVVEKMSHERMGNLAAGILSPPRRPRHHHQLRQLDQHECRAHCPHRCRQGLFT